MAGPIQHQKALKPDYHKTKDRRVRPVFFWKAGASEGIRTLDIHLGKVTLYQTELHSR